MVRAAWLEWIIGAAEPWVIPLEGLVEGVVIIRGHTDNNERPDAPKWLV